MPHRDPETGQFLPSEDLDAFDDIEQVNFGINTSVPAADLDGLTGQGFGETSAFEAEEMYDVGDVIDRFELAALLWAYHRIVVYATSTATADSTVRGSIEISTSPNRDRAGGVSTGTDIEDQPAEDFQIEKGNVGEVDTADIIGPVLQAVGFGPITDGTNGVGGAGTAGTDQWEGPVLVEPVLDERDSLFVNGHIAVSNASDLAVHVDVMGWHVLGILED